MEKLLLAVDSQHLNEKAMQFACYLTRLTQSKLTGVFLDEPAMEEQIIYQSKRGETFVESVLVSETDEVATGLLESGISLFKKITLEEGVSANIHLDKGVPEEEIIAESKFADALIVDADSSFSEYEDDLLSDFLKNILHDAGCPVIICPESFEGIDNIIFFYDGSKSSIFAIKQFSHLFPQLKSKRLKVLYLNNEKFLLADEERRLTEWLKYHFDNSIEWFVLQDDTKESLFEYFVNKKDDFIVMGAYGKGLLTSFFNRQDKRVPAIPIFVSHF